MISSNIYPRSVGPSKRAVRQRSLLRIDLNGRDCDLSDATFAKLRSREVFDEILKGRRVSVSNVVAKIEWIDVDCQHPHAHGAGNVAMQGVAHVNARRRTLPHRIQGEKEGLSFRLFHTDHVGINDGGDAHVVTIDAAHRHP